MHCYQGFTTVIVTDGKLASAPPGGAPGERLGKDRGDGCRVTAAVTCSRSELAASARPSTIGGLKWSEKERKRLRGRSQPPASTCRLTSALVLLGELQAVEARVLAVAGEKLVVRAVLDDAAL